MCHNKSHAYLWKCICGPLKCYHVTSHHRWRRICLSTDSFKNWQDIKPKVGIFKSGILISFVTLNWYFVYYKVIYLSIRNTTNYIYHLLVQTLKESLTKWPFWQVMYKEVDLLGEADRKWSLTYCVQGASH